MCSIFCFSGPSGNFFRLFFGGSHSLAIFEVIDERFFARDRKMKNNFQIGRQKLKIVFEDKKSLGYFFLSVELKQFCDHFEKGGVMGSSKKI